MILYINFVAFSVAEKFKRSIKQMSAMDTNNLHMKESTNKPTIGRRIKLCAVDIKIYELL